MRTTIRSLFVGSAVIAILLGVFQRAAAQSNSYSHMLTVTSTLNANFYREMNRYQETTNRLKKMTQSYGNSSQAAPGNGSARPAAQFRQYPITATDFKPIFPRMAPDLLANAKPGLTREQKEAVKALGNQYLTAFESQARKNNVANAMTFLVGVSLLVVTGKEISDAESDQMILAFNNALAATPAFLTMPPRDKQILYEEAVVIGGLIAFTNQQGVEQKNPALQAEAKEISRAMIKNFLGFDVR
jgi:hypothetical protein